MNYKIIAESIWRSGYIKDKNKVRQEAREKMRRLIALDISSFIEDEKERAEFLKNCSL